MNDPGTRPPPPPEVGPILRVLNDHAVDYVIVGGVAGLAHGAAIPTFDLDIAYARDHQNIRRLVGALRELGATLRVAGDPPEPLPFDLDERSIENGANFTFNTKYGALDILGDPGGVSSYEALHRGSDAVTIRGHRARRAGLDHLIAMKRHANRPKDKLMLEEYKVIADELHRRRES